MKPWDALADDVTIEKTIQALKQHGMDASVVSTSVEAKERVLTLIPEGAEVMTMTSVTLDTVGLSQEINESGRYQSVRKKLFAMNRDAERIAMLKLGAAPEWAVGSANVVTQDGHVLIASATGSQLPAYVYGSAHVIWVVGAQKIVATTDEGMKRIYAYTLPLESERAHKAYGVPGSSVNKVMVINTEIVSGRITVLFVKEKIGF